MISTLNGWSRSTMNARASAGVISLSSNGWSAAMLSRIRASIARQVVGRQRARQQQVVVEAVVDDRADAELGAREQVHDRLGQDVRSRVAHRAELAAGAVVHQLGGRAALGRLEADLDLDLARVDRRPRRCPVPRLICLDLLENHETPRPSTGREASSRGPTRLRHRSAGALVVALTGDARAGSPAAHGWYRCGGDRRASSRGPALWGSAPRGASRSTLVPFG